MRGSISRKYWHDDTGDSSSSDTRDGGWDRRQRLLRRKLREKEREDRRRRSSGGLVGAVVSLAFRAFLLVLFIAAVLFAACAVLDLMTRDEQESFRQEVDRSRRLNEKMQEQRQKLHQKMMKEIGG